MRFTWLFTLAVSLGLASGSAAWADSEDAQPEFVSDVGALKCQQFDAFLSGDQQEVHAAWLIMIPWMHGFEAAWNEVRTNMLNKDPLDLYSDTYSESAQKAFISSFCKAHPDYQIIDAQMALITAMQQTQ